MNRKLAESNDITLNSLIALSNINIKIKPLDTVIHSLISTDTLVIPTRLEEPVTQYKNQYLVVGDEIVKIFSIDNTTKDTIDGKQKDSCHINIIRQQFHTQATETLIGKHCRLVTILTYENQGSDILSYSFTDSATNTSSDLFSVDLSNGSLVFTDNFQRWSPLSTLQEYQVHNKKTIVYFFKGQNNDMILKNLSVVEKISFSTGTSSEIKRITIALKSYLYKWYNQDVSSIQVLKNMQPKEFFKTIFKLKDNEVYYVTGVDPNKAITVNRIALKSFKKVNELLKAYCKHSAIRFTFDKFERIKIFTDYFIDNLQVDDHFSTNISDIMVNDDNKLIFNTVKGDIYSNLPMYNFDDLDRCYVNFKKKIPNAFMSNEMLGFSGQTYYPLEITIPNNDLFTSCTIGDYVLAKCTFNPYTEFYGRVIIKEAPNKVKLTFFAWDKDYRLLVQGKEKYINNLLNTVSKPMDLYYVRFELPDIFRFNRNIGGQSREFALDYPILPKVDGEPIHRETIDITFGSASNLKVGSYSGTVEDINKIFGVWDNQNLKYNMEYSQSHSSTTYPPIYMLSNHITEKKFEEGWVAEYTTFDNSDIQLTVEENLNSDKNIDATLILMNTRNIPKTQLFIDQEIDRKGNQFLRVSDISLYHIGDVLIVNKPEDNPTQQELEEYNNKLKGIRWTIKGKYVETVGSETHHYILVDSPFAKRNYGKKYKFTKFPNESVVFLQELYIKGNPIIQHKQSFVGVSSDRTKIGESSKSLYEEKKYDLGSQGLLEKTEIEKLLGYVLNNYNATSNETTKYKLPLKLFNALHIEPLDIITIDDPIFTNINKDTYKWIVLSVKISSDTNNVELDCLNVNKKNTKPYSLDIKNVLEYKPLNIPKYSNTGTENLGNGQSNSTKDDDVGQVWVSKIDEKEFSAIVEKYNNGYIWFKGFDGTKQAEYKDKLFGKGVEFVVDINGEMILVNSDLQYRAMIRKRQMYATNYNEILAGQKVKFLAITIHTDVDGTLYGRRIHIGDNKNYFHYDMVNGATFRGNFQVGEANKTADNDLYNALQNNRVFRDSSKPLNNSTTRLKKGDIWYDTANGNKPYIYDGANWISARDKALENNLEFSKIIYSNEPQVIGIQDNDFWVDTDDNNNIYIRKNNTWVSFYTAPTFAKTGQKVFHQVNEPVSDFNYQLKEGDIWFNPNTGLIRKSFRHNRWEDIREPYIISTLNGRYVFIGQSTPTVWRNKDIFINVTDKKIYKNNNGNSEVIGNRILEVENNNKIHFVDSYPKGTAKTGDLWVDTDNNYIIYFYHNGNWDSQFNNINSYVQDSINISKSLNKYVSDTITNIENIGGDNKITPMEKQSLKKEVEILKANHSILKNKADVFPELSPKMLVLDTLQQKVIDFCNPLLADMNVTSPVVSDEFRRVFVNYYEKYNDLLTEIIQKSSDKAKDEAIKDVKARIDGIKKLVDETLGKQTDGKIQSWYQPNDPATNWTTQQGQKAHTGDLWYKSDDNTMWRWDGTQWKPIQSTAEDRIARNLAKNKSTIYTSTPIPPYNKGDFWVNDKQLYMCKTSRNKTDNFNQSDWELATNYTDDTTANKVKDKVESGDITLNGNTVVNGDFKVRGENIVIDGNTKIIGALQLFGGQGFILYNGTTESTSNRRIILQNGVIYVQARSN